MSEIILKKIDQKYHGAIPHLGLIEVGQDPAEIYQKLSEKELALRKNFEEAQLSELLNSHSDQAFRVLKLEKKLKSFLFISLALYFLGLVGLGTVVYNSGKRIAASISQSFGDQTSAQKEKGLKNFQKILKTYQPHLHELKKAWNEPVDEQDPSQAR